MKKIIFRTRILRFELAHCYFSTNKRLLTCFRFPEAIESGLIDIISPPLHYYPEFSSLRRTLDDDPERVKWRSKQNLDYAFLMMYAQSRGMFYVQLEDDILAKTNFITTMKSVALKAIVRRQNWFVLDFCQLGFIGKFQLSSLDTFLCRCFAIVPIMD